MTALSYFESHFKRNYIHVRDVCRTFLHGIDNFESMKSQIYNVGLSSANVSKFDYAKKISEQVPGFVFLEHNPKDQIREITWFQMQRKTGWQPTFTPRTGYQIDKGLQNDT